MGGVDCQGLARILVPTKSGALIELAPFAVVQQVDKCLTFNGDAFGFRMEALLCRLPANHHTLTPRYAFLDLEWKMHYE
jgi:aspartate aminotransferase-like enzyme